MTSREKLDGGSQLIGKPLGRPGLESIGVITKLLPASASSELARLRGWTARRRHYSATHDRLTVEVSFGAEVRYLNFVFCGRLSIPAGWKVLRPALNQAEPGQLRFVDEGVELVCAECGVQDFDPDP